MTQAFNLGQLANKVNTSGQLDASTGLINSVVVANGGTGRATLTAGTVLVGNGTSQVTMLAGTTTNDALIWSGTAWASSPIATAGGGGGYAMTTFVSPATYTKPVSLKAIKITLQGGGGNGGNAFQGPSPNLGSKAGGGGSGAFAVKYIDAPAIPASPITITAGAGTNSFGALVSATGGANATPTGPGTTNGAGGAGGTATNATFSVPGFQGQPGASQVTTLTAAAIGGGANSMNLGIGAAGVVGVGGVPGNNATIGYGSGGSGGAIAAPNILNITRPGGTGTPGIIIIEEFF
jgi:hypothetical protein